MEITGHDYSCVLEYCQSQAATEVKRINIFNTKNYYWSRANWRGKMVNCRLPVKNLENVNQRGYSKLGGYSEHGHAYV